jgi:hypothetical protein
MIVSDAVLNAVVEVAGKREWSRFNDRTAPQRGARVETFDATNGAGRRATGRHWADRQVGAARVRARRAERPG